MGKHKNTSKGRSNTQKGVSPTPSSHVGEAGNTGNVGHDLRDEVASMRRHYHKWVLLPKCPFALHYVADHHLNDLYHLGIDKVTQHKKIRLTTASELE